LIREFMKAVAEPDIDLAPARVRVDLGVLKSYASDPAKKDTAARIIDGWTTAAAGDPLVRGVRKSVTDDLRLWLGTARVKAVQMKLMDKNMRRAYALASAWKRDSSNGATPAAVDGRLLATFFDLVTFNGDMAGIWVPHVKQFRQEHIDMRSILQIV